MYFARGYHATTAAAARIVMTPHGSRELASRATDRAITRYIKALRQGKVITHAGSFAAGTLRITRKGIEQVVPQAARQTLPHTAGASARQSSGQTAAPGPCPHTAYAAASVYYVRGDFVSARALCDYLATLPPQTRVSLSDALTAAVHAERIHCDRGYLDDHMLVRHHNRCDHNLARDRVDAYHLAPDDALPTAAELMSLYVLAAASDRHRRSTLDVSRPDAVRHPPHTQPIPTAVAELPTTSAPGDRVVPARCSCGVRWCTAARTATSRRVSRTER